MISITHGNIFAPLWWEDVFVLLIRFVNTNEVLAFSPGTGFTGFAFPPHRMEGKMQQETETIILSVQRKKML